MELKYAIERKAGRKLLRSWRSKKEWEKMITRVRQAEQQWRINKDRDAWARNQLYHHIMHFCLIRSARKALKQKKAEYAASFVIVRFFRAGAAKNIVRRIKAQKARRMMKWAFLAQGLLDARLHRSAKIIQRAWRGRLMYLERINAARLMQRAWRGLKGR